MLTYLRVYYEEWKERRFLRSHHCSTRKQYNRKYDPDHNFRATHLREFYHGYKYFHYFPNYSHAAYTTIYDYGPGGYKMGYHLIEEWCEENLTHKWRKDGHRCLVNHWGQWEINEIGGGDLIFFAFQNKEDYFMFSLKWGGVTCK